MVALGRPARICLTRLGDFLGGHVVEQDGVGVAGDGLLEFDGRADFDLDDLAGLAAGERAGEDGGQAAAERDVVVLDEDSVLQVEAVVDAAAAADGVLIQRAQAGDGLAGVEDFGLGFGGGDGADEFVGEGGDAGHALHEVEDDALGGEDAGGVGADDGDGLALADADAVEDLGVGDDFEAAGGFHFSVEREEGGDAADAGDDAGLLGDDGARWRAGRDRR